MPRNFATKPLCREKQRQTSEDRNLTTARLRPEYEPGELLWQHPAPHNSPLCDLGQEGAESKGHRLPMNDQ